MRIRYFVLPSVFVVCSIILDFMFSSLGHEKEDFLKRKLDELGLPYQGNGRIRKGANNNNNI